MSDQYDQRRDPRNGGGQEYAPQHQPVSRPAPNGFQPGAQAPVPMHAPDYPHAGKGVEDRFAPPPAAHAHQTPTPTAMPSATNDANVVMLSQPYRAFDVMVQRLTFRAPVGRDIAKCGNPIKLITAPDGTIRDIEVRWDAVIKYIPLLATPPVPPSTAEEFSYFDLDACASALIPFFVRFSTIEKS